MFRMLLVPTAGLVVTISAAFAQVPLSSYVDAQGFIDVQKLTCAQLAGTFQEDADMLATWYSGWYNGLAKKHYLDFRNWQNSLYLRMSRGPDRHLARGDVGSLSPP